MGRIGVNVKIRVIYLLYGEDTYRSRVKLREIVAEFLKKAGGILNVTAIDAEENPEAVLSVGRFVSFFSEKQLFVIENASSADDAVHKYVRARALGWERDPNFTVVFWERTGEGEKNKFIDDIKSGVTKLQESRPLAGAGLSRWIDNQAVAEGARLAPEEKRLLISRHGSDLWAICVEIAKIKAGWSLREVTGQDAAIWDFTDGFFKNRRRSFYLLANLLQAGFDPIYILGALASRLRRQLVFTAAKRDYVREITLLQKEISALVEADVELKTGRLPPPLPLLKLVLR